MGTPQDFFGKTGSRKNLRNHSKKNRKF